jgi:hypothetical protein
MKYAVEMVLDAMIYTYVPSFIMTGSDIQKLIGGYLDTQTVCDLISLLSCFQNEESGLKIKGGLWHHLVACVSVSPSKV